MGGRGFKSRSGQTFFQTFTLQIYIYIYINCNARVRLFGHLFATLSFMLHAKQSSGDSDIYLYLYLSIYLSIYKYKL